MASPRRILSELGLAPQKGRGQNFLADPNLPRRIVSLAGFEPDRPVLEIGPGLGALTRPLLEAGCRVTAVEVDRGLAAYLEDGLAREFPGRLNVVCADVLEFDLESLGANATGGLGVIGNLPYVISSPLVVRLIDRRDLIGRAVLMFQREFADRLSAGPGTKVYGRLSVLAGYFARVKKLMDIGPEAFHPRPKVGSSVIEMTFRDSPEPGLVSEDLFRRVTAAGFARRRKTLANALGAAFGREASLSALAAAGIDPGRRAETLSLEEFAFLANALAAEL